MTSLERAKELALRTLTRRTRTQAEIEKLLIAHGYDEQTVGACIAYLREYRYIDDEAYCLSFLRSRIDYKHKGVIWCRQALRQRGVSWEMIEHACNTVEQAREIEAAYTWAIPKWTKYCTKAEPHRARAMMYRDLVRRGFQNAVVQHILEKLQRSNDVQEH
jgi:regulatory protein